MVSRGRSRFGSGRPISRDTRRRLAGGRRIELKFDIKRAVVGKLEVAESQDSGEQHQAGRVAHHGLHSGRHFHQQRRGRQVVREAILGVVHLHRDRGEQEAAPLHAGSSRHVAENPDAFPSSPLIASVYSRPRGPTGVWKNSSNLICVTPGGSGGSSIARAGSVAAASVLAVCVNAADSAGLRNARTGEEQTAAASIAAATPDSAATRADARKTRLGILAHSNLRTKRSRNPAC